MTYIADDFGQGIAAHWQVTQIGAGQVWNTPGALGMTVQPTVSGSYSNAQISDYRGRSDFRCRPPVQLTVRARMASSADGIQGTAGFGFWNHPFVPGERGFRLPRAVWFFFSSPPSAMELAQGVPGHGWKAATFDATRWPFLALLPAAPLGFLLMRIPALYKRLWPLGQRAVGVSEYLLDSSLLAEMHTYTLDWQHEYVDFSVDGCLIHRAGVRISGPLGFIAWIDNQYAVVTPQGRFGFGLLPVAQPQALILEEVRLLSKESKK